jgi:hypothetical protein
LKAGIKNEIFNEIPLHVKGSDHPLHIQPNPSLCKPTLLPSVAIPSVAIPSVAIPFGATHLLCCPGFCELARRFSPKQSEALTKQLH